jgi:hypothetical protein
MENYYIVDITAYKRSIYIDALKPFLHNLKEFYHSSKYNYIDPEIMNQNKSNVIHLRIDIALYESLRNLALANFRTINNEILLAIHNHLKSNQESGK